MTILTAESEIGSVEKISPYPKVTLVCASCLDHNHIDDTSILIGHLGLTEPGTHYYPTAQADRGQTDSVTILSTRKKFPTQKPYPPPIQGVNMKLNHHCL